MGIRKVREWKKHIIIRPAWIYGPFKDNFVTRVLKWAKERDEIYMANDQTGSPTHAGELAKFILFLLRKPDTYGTFHFSDEGEATRYDMAVEIVRYANLPVKVIPVPSSYFKPLAKRPPYSVLSKQKIKTLWDYPVFDRKENLRRYLNELL